MTCKNIELYSNDKNVSKDNDKKYTNNGFVIHIVVNRYLSNKPLISYYNKNKKVCQCGNVYIGLRVVSEGDAYFERCLDCEIGTKFNKLQ